MMESSVRGAGVWQPLDVARLEEPRIREALGAIVPEREAWCGGVMCRGEPGSWVNQAVGGVGMEGAEPGAGDVDRLIEFYASRGIEPRVELTPFASRGLMRQLGEAGFVLLKWETIFACELGGWEAPREERAAGLSVEVLAREDAAAVDDFCRRMHVVFAGREPSEADMRTLRAMVAFEKSTGFVARIDGEFVGGGMVDDFRECAAVYFGGTLEGRRRRGVQTALLIERLRFLKGRGCAVATIGGEPMEGTERNALRVGFLPSYNKVALVKPGEGLKRSEG